MKTSIIKTEPPSLQPEAKPSAITVLTSEEALERVGNNGTIQKCMIAILIPCFSLANIIIYGVSYMTKRPLFYCGGVECDMQEACDSGIYTVQYDNNLKNLTGKLKLECISDTAMGFIGSCYFIGFMAGALFIPRLADIFGRRWIIIAGLLCNVVGVILVVFANSLSFIYAAMIILGLQSPATMQVSFVMITEIVGTKYRAFYSTLILSINAFLNLFNPAYYYLAKDFMPLMYATLALGGVLLLFSLCILSQSPRFYISIRNFQKARSALNHFARRNKKAPLDSTKQFLEGEKRHADVEHHQEQDLLEVPHQNQRKSLLPQDNKPRSQGIKDLCKQGRVLICPLIIMSVNWFLMGFVNYGIYFGVKYLEANIYLAGIVIGISQILGYPAGGIMIALLGRKKNGVLGCLFSVVFCILYLASSWLDWSVALILTFAGLCNLGINVANSSLYLMTAQLFPTVFRATVFGVVNIFGRTGGILSPLVNQYLKKDSFFMIVFGAFMGGLGVLMLFLPETKEQNLPDTLKQSVLSQLKVSLKE